MYDSPKAIHFVASQNGNELPHNSIVGMRLRWAAARHAAEMGITDMLSLKASDWDRLTDALSVYGVRMYDKRPA